ncbi:MAG: zinc metallopeptidase [Ruminococcus sp.]|nr:zinc metallopeptidase [Ruminococcus sp.]
MYGYGYSYGDISAYITDILLLIGMMIIPLIAQIAVSATFSRNSRVHSSRGLTAEQVARRILDLNGLHDVRIERIGGKLSDHYDPRDNVVRLSDSVYGQTSVAAIGIAAHECGHACQHAEAYKPILIRSKLVPVTNICSYLWFYVFLAGCVLTFLPFLIYVGIAMFCAVILFQIVTLPTELNASRRAMKTLEGDCILEPSELKPARKVLTAAAMTYVAGLASSIMQLVRLLLRARR